MNDKELLELVIEAKRLIDKAFEHDGDVFGVEHNNAVDFIDAAKQAIAKATGGKAWTTFKTH
jgi:hypothetical protein